MTKKILAQMGYHEEPISVCPFIREEDGEEYGVWRVEYPDKTLVLKQAKGREYEIYRTFLSSCSDFSPKIYGFTTYNGAQYLLMEYIQGHDLMKCTREDLTKALDSLIRMQQASWNGADLVNSFGSALEGRQKRANYLHNERLEQAYDAYLQEFSALPRALCHDDLLPFNVIVSDTRAVFIDWEVGGMLPYPTSLARLIAHAAQDESAFFFMKEDDKAFAIDYYFDQFIKGRGIPYETYRRSLDLCLFYEYCEWIYVGYKYNNMNNDRFIAYSVQANQMAEKLGY